VIDLSLDKCLVGDKVYVLKIDSLFDIKRRLLDIGLSYGTEVLVLYDSICGGIRAYKIRDTLIGIRDIDAKNIIVRRVYE
jgi:Fe2+ transport system protein FeoA